MKAKHFEAVRVNEHVYWVGAIDWGIRNFHGYTTSRGTTYNAYLILADKVTLIDTVKAPFLDELLGRIRSVIDPEKIDYIVSNHSEMDHTGSLPAVIDAVKPEKVFASKMGNKALAAHHLDRVEIEAVENGGSLSLGNLNLRFWETRMLHWPDSMVSYLAEDKLLFSQDGFGMHLASSERFADEIEPSILKQEAAKYYANILLPYSTLITRLLATVKEVGIDIKVLAPDHGPVWRKDFDILGWYGGWAKQKPTMKAVVAFDTMWHSTELMARAISEGLVEGGATVKVMPLGSSDRSEVVTELLDAGAFLVGSPTLNNNMFPTVADLLCYVRGLKPKNLVGQAFGSYGWSGESVNQLVRELEQMKVELVGEPAKVNYVPDETALARCKVLGRQVAEKIAEKLR
ncbi:MBL fold metallo-hydrolase [candidate division WOR-3 bacterium JGI_Cruoil_03_51_56]|uniref:MBL fold metallo-hydrolase n=1 Tax=candidate division WOR-3 bacterium JGI_Cruoil_03_51_56 TaxID=1973747 RepID=A0A235BR78_UNCW3|nr:MAG: MBL fold metallo-hydrolase [candidate division WOR-3 bacterium JGI_Cruoil_03_51_56]